jgi:hypothetical protein
MLENVKPAKLTRIGRVEITTAGIGVIGFEGENTSCRDVAALAIVWAIGELQRELLATLERPGGDNVWVD